MLDTAPYTVDGHCQFAIGQRAFLLQTAAGNVLWDLIAYLDQQTIDFVSQTLPTRKLNVDADGRVRSIQRVD